MLHREHHEHCSICAELTGTTGLEGSVYEQLTRRDRSRVLWETDGLVLLPTIGPLTVGHMLMFPKDHYLSYAHLAESEFRIFAEHYTAHKKMLTDRFGSVIAFEHGPMSQSAMGGACTDHAHVHFVPSVDGDLQEVIEQRLARFFQGMDYPGGREISDLTEIREQADREAPYIFFEDQRNRRWVFDVVGDLPCQFMRRVIAESVGVSDEWDWMGCPRQEVFVETVDAVTEVLDGEVA
jgi:diadenosine tetraphosphate (Ap4A) HIT family hydrolase